LEKLTRNAIKRLKAKPVRYDQPDDKITGLALAVFPSSVKSWTLRYTIKGKVWRQTLGKYPAISIQNARRIATNVLREVAHGKNPQQEKVEARQRRALGLDRDDTFATAWADYIAKHVTKKLKPSTSREIQRIGTKLVLPKIGKRMLKEISPREVKALISLIANHAPIGANRVLAVLTAFWNWSVNELIVVNNPCDGLARPNSEKLRKRKRILSDREIKWFWQACDQIGYPFGPLFKIALLTGARRGEVAGMLWDELDVPARTWMMPGTRTKNHRPHTVHIGDLFKAIIERIPIHGGGFVFSKGRTPPSGFSRAKRRVDAIMAKLAKDEFEAVPEPFTVHDLRRTTASGLAKLKINLATVELCLNHWSGELGGLREVYVQHEQSAEMAEAFTRWNDYVVGIVAMDSNSF
jgi:integrase